MDDFPFLSIIIPVKNAQETIQKCIDSVIYQSYPREKYEIIIVDNGSTDQTTDIVQNYNVKLLINDLTASPYVARNTGLRIAKGKIFCFIDGNCYAHDNWLSSGVIAMKEGKADLIGGHVEFVFKNRNSGSEWFDALYNIRMEDNIKKRNVAKTANLLVKKKVFDEIGNFPENVRSGGDVIWTGRATLNGFKLIFAKDAIVYKYTRGFRDILKKQYRVAKGQPYIWKLQGDTVNVIKRKNRENLLRFMSLRNPGIFSVARKLKKRDNFHFWLTVKVWLVGNLCHLFMYIGRKKGIRKLETSKE